MGWYRRGKLALDRFSILASRVAHLHLKIQFFSVSGRYCLPHPESVRVRMIAKDIIDALQRGLRKEQYASENAMLVEGDESETLSALAGSEEKVEGSSHEDDDKWVQKSQIKEIIDALQRGSQAATSNLNQLNWEIFVANEPEVNASYIIGGKIVVSSGMCDLFKSDAEIAAAIGHEVGHGVARHVEEERTMKLLVDTLQLILILYQFVWPGIVNRMHSLFLLLMGEIEADHIGMLLIASASYDPRQWSLVSASTHVEGLRIM
ncbi:Mitochondrial metalloendopeptidase OMA1 [Spatholobus suberectus]|nr:Mitochondrial metalloendopeptidase OMA1 [Spatholobus suberectus]